MSDEVKVTQVRHWQAPNRIQINRESGWGYKYMRKEDVERRLLEGWEICRKSEMVMKETGDTESTQRYRSLVLMRMPQHMVDERNSFYIERHNRRLRAAGKGAIMKGVTSKAQTSTSDDSNKLAGTIGKGLLLKEGVTREGGIVHSKTTVISPDSRDLTDDDIRGAEDLRAVKEGMKEEEEERREERSQSKKTRRK